MATIKPFKGIRPPQDLVEQVASRPYDVQKLPGTINHCTTSLNRK